MSIALLYTLILFTGKLTMYNQSELQVSLHLRQNINVLLVEMGMKEYIVRVPRIEKHSYLMSLFQKLNSFFVIFHAENSKDI